MSKLYILGRLAANPRTHLGRMPPELSAAIADYAEHYVSPADICKKLCEYVPSDVWSEAVASFIMEHPEHMGALEMQYAADNGALRPAEMTAHEYYWMALVQNDLHPYRGFILASYYESIRACLKVCGAAFTVRTIRKFHPLAADDVPTLAAHCNLSSEQTDALTAAAM